MSKINIEGSEISVIAIGNRDYISLTDMVRNIENGSALIEKWLRNKNTIEFLGIWEDMYNPNFNSPEFEGIKNEAGFNRFVLSVKQWVEKTDSIGDVSQLVCLSNLENLNAVFINEGMKQSERLEKLNSIAIEQMKILSEGETVKKLK